MSDEKNPSCLEEEFNEYKELEVEIKSRNADLRMLRSRRKFLKESIETYLKSTNQPGFICGSSIIFCDQKPKRARVKKADKETAALSYLKSKGIDANTEFLTEFLESMKGEKVMAADLKIKSFSG